MSIILILILMNKYFALVGLYLRFYVSLWQTGAGVWCELCGRAQPSIHSVVKLSIGHVQYIESRVTQKK